MNRFNCILAVSVLLLAVSCRKAIEPLSSNYYTDENIDQYPTLIKGLVDKAYDLATVTTYVTGEHIYMDCATDNAVATSTTTSMRKLANGSISPADDPMKAYWSRDYTGIYYVNRFLENDKGFRTRFMLDDDQDLYLRMDYKGESFALRAWFLYDLLVKFGGRGTDGKLYGVPIFTSATIQSTISPAEIVRAPFDSCATQIIRDCDSALVYLPLANRDGKYARNASVEGSCRWGRFDGMSVKALKALTYLLWASPAFNPGNDVKRWEKAAEFAAAAMKDKLDVDKPLGFDPAASFDWTDPNTPEAYWISRPSAKTSTMETSQYPTGFNGKGLYAPSQELVDAYPAANGYPKDHVKSNYNPAKPYENRDPRFYQDIFYNGGNLYDSKNEVIYTFDTYKSGKDANGLPGNGLTNYYLKKFIYMGWNLSDASTQTMPRAVIYIGWRDMCLAFAEAANRAYASPTEEHFGFSAKQALGYIRSRKTSDGTKGVGAGGDAYLDECSGNKEKFETLVRNERRIEFCFEGKRFVDLVRWGIPLEQRNVPVHRVEITQAGGNFTYTTVEADKRNMPSVFLPLPYSEMLNATSLVQNEGWSLWK